MKRNEIIATLKAAEPELCKRGIRHAALFGSVARGKSGSTATSTFSSSSSPVKKAPSTTMCASRNMSRDCSKGRSM